MLCMSHPTVMNSMMLDLPFINGVRKKENEQPPQKRRISHYRYSSCGTHIFHANTMTKATPTVVDATHWLFLEFPTLLHTFNWRHSHNRRFLLHRRIL